MVRCNRPPIIHAFSCRKCAESCPSNALSTGDKEAVRGVAKWPTNAERCYGYWRAMGTDCAICMSVCPFSLSATDKAREGQHSAHFLQMEQK